MSWADGLQQCLDLTGHRSMAQLAMSLRARGINVAYALAEDNFVDYLHP